MIIKLAVGALIGLASLVGVSADSSSAAKDHYTVSDLQSPPFSTCMAAAGQPSVPLPSVQQRRGWSASAQAAYRSAFWSCVHSALGVER